MKKKRNESEKERKKEKNRKKKKKENTKSFALSLFYIDTVTCTPICIGNTIVV